MISFVDRKVGRESLLVILGALVMLVPDRLDKTVGCAERVFEEKQLATISKQIIRRDRRKRARAQELKGKSIRWLGRQDAYETRLEMKNERHLLCYNTCGTTAPVLRNGKHTLRIIKNNNTVMKGVNMRMIKFDDAVEMALVFFAFFSQFLTLRSLWHDEVEAIKHCDASSSYFCVIPWITVRFFSILLVSATLIWVLFHVITILIKGIAMKDTNARRQQAITTTSEATSIKTKSRLPFTKQSSFQTTLTVTTTETLSCLEENEDNSYSGMSLVQKDLSKTRARNMKMLRWFFSR